MDKKIKLWSSLSVATLISAGVLSGCEPQSEGESTSAQPAEGPSSYQADAGSKASKATAEKAADSGGALSASGGEGEGEGEGEGGGAVDLGTDDIAFVTRLELIRGHLWVGMELFRAGHLEQARTHMKHPKDELYAALKPAFKARGLEPFDSALTDLATAVENDAGAGKVEDAYAALEDELARTRGATPLAPHERLQVVARLVRTAGEEYAIGVNEQGKVINAHEYQDALGFVTVAESMLESIETGGKEEVAETVAQVKKLIEPLHAAWSGVMPPESVDFDPSKLHGAAARIELAALSLD